jgi:dTDP-4-amino-4,6-dideoxygalactose transaminase
MTSRIWLSPPHIGQAEQALVEDAFRSNWIAPVGPHVDAFEEELAAAIGVSHAVALNSGTAAIHLALVLLGVERGDWVLCQSLTFAGTVNPVAYLHATPVLVDSEPATWNMDPEALREAIEEARRRGTRPKAIIPVHLYGMPARMDEILAIAREHEIPVIEDAAEALGSSLNGRPCGTFGDMSVLSFNGNKIVTTSGGGALLADRADWAQRARFLATQARDPAPHYQHSEIGYNYRLSNVLAAIGRGQLGHLAARVAAKRAAHERYRAFFSPYPGVSFLAEPDGAFSNRWLTTILVDPALTNGVTREALRVALAEDDIEARPFWKPLHCQPVFQECPYFGSRLSERLFGLGLCLPSGSSLTDDQFARISGRLAAALEGAR